MTTIPKIIHQIWIGPAKCPDRFLKTWSVDYIGANPDYQYILWDDDKINKLMSFNTNIKKIYTAEPTYYGKADIARYVILYYYGGIYIDADSVWVNDKSLTPLICQDDVDFVAGMEPNREWFACGVIGTTPFNPKTASILRYFESMSDNYEEIRRNTHPWKLTGALCLSRLSTTFPQNKFCVVECEDPTSNMNIFPHESLDNALNYMKNCKHNSILYDVRNQLVISHKCTNELDYDKCVKYIRQVYNSKTMGYPAYIFYPRDWFNITDPELHMKMILPNDSCMFHYGITTNGGALKY